MINADNGKCGKCGKCGEIAGTDGSGAPFLLRFFSLSFSRGIFLWEHGNFPVKNIVCSACRRDSGNMRAGADLTICLYYAGTNAGTDVPQFPHHRGSVSVRMWAKIAALYSRRFIQTSRFSQHGKAGLARRNRKLRPRAFGPIIQRLMWTEKDNGKRVELKKAR